MKIHDVKQGTNEWLNLRIGVWTASAISELLTAKLEIAKNETSRSLIQRIARERISGIAENKVETFDMIRGSSMEPIAREYYHNNFNEVKEVGFCTSEIQGIIIGCSPDGLVNEDGLIEIKSRKPAVYFKELLSDETPNCVLPQIQFQLLVTGRSWCDYISFCDGWPLIVRRIYNDTPLQGIIIQAIIQAEKEVAITISEYSKKSSHFIKTEKIPDADNSLLT